MNSLQTPTVFLKCGLRIGLDGEFYMVFLHLLLLFIIYIAYNEVFMSPF